MSPGGLNGSGIHKLPLELDEPRRKPSKWGRRMIAALKIAGYIGIALGSGVGAYVKATGENKGTAEAAGTSAAIAVLQEQSKEHKEEITAIKTWMENKGETINRIAYRVGVIPLDKPPPNLGVVPMPAASRPRPKPMEPQ